MKTDMISRLFILIGIFLGGVVTAQEALPSKEELKEMKAQKEAQISSIQGEVDAISKQIASYPGWKFGGNGLVGLNVGRYNNWFPNEVSSSRQNSFSIGLSGFANLDSDKEFWRTNLEWNAGSSKTRITQYDDNTGTQLPDDEVEARNDLFVGKSLYGRRLSKTWALSGQALYTTAILGDRFNNPGNLLAGVGATWTPVPNLVAVIHPLAYNWVFSDGGSSFVSSPGANVTVDYVGTIAGRFGWKSQLLTFLSYDSASDNEPGLSWWNWTNSVTFNAFKGIGVGVNFGLRGNQQESFNFERNTLKNENVNVDDLEGDIQSFFTVGLTYSLF